MSSNTTVRTKLTVDREHPHYKPPVGSLFAAFLGYNPVQTLLGDGNLATLPVGDRSTLTGREFFPNLISQPFHRGLVIAFGAAVAMSVIGAAASMLRGARYVHTDEVVQREAVSVAR